MALVDDVHDLADRTLSALDASHDDYTYTKRVWRLLQGIVQEGRKFTFRNLVTGTRVDEQVILGRAQLYVTEYLASSTFQHFVSLFEEFFIELLRYWLVAYPGSTGSRDGRMALPAPLGPLLLRDQALGRSGLYRRDLIERLKQVVRTDRRSAHSGGRPARR